MTDLLDQDATAQLEALQARRISSEELLTAALARADRLQSRLNTVVSRAPERALGEARAMDAARSRGDSLGALAGLPMTVKDTFDVAGLPASSGLPELLDRTCEDAVVVARARAAGAVVWGKTNVPVMAADWQSYNDLYGTSNNPWNPGRTTGGSSGGAAASLAAGITPLEIGSDIGGSLRVPANFCGVWSHKPTWGAVSQRGHVPPRPGARAARDLNVVGPMARSARDLRLLYSVIADSPAPPEPPPAPGSLRIGLWLDDPAFRLDPTSRSVIEAYARELASAGVKVEPVASPVDTRRLMSAYRLLLGSVIVTDMAPEHQQHMMSLREQAKAALAAGANDPALGLVLDYTATHAEWLAADEVRAQLRDQAVEAMSGFDAILAPVTPVAAFPHDHGPFQGRELVLSDGSSLPYTSILDWIAMATACHLPATCAPAGLNAEGLPVGVQLIGRPGADAALLAMAQTLALVRDFVPPPA